MTELKPCPFCGGKVNLVLCDNEGNLHDYGYREHPYSGLAFMLCHTHEGSPDCPIASYECDGVIFGGVHIYDTEEEAAETWNRRAVAPIIRGRWTRYSTTMMSCSVCGRHTARHKFLYCPHCGAKMDGGDDDDT